MKPFKTFDNKKIIITGAAGFVGYRLVESLSKKNCAVFSVDQLSHFKNRKEHHTLSYDQIIDRNDFIDRVEHHLKGIDLVFHLGACTDTTITDWSYLERINLNYSQALWNACSRLRIPFVYASSAATYGEGELGFNDDENKISELKPLNLYGKSKQDFDLWVLKQEQKSNTPPFWSGFKFFNVYGFGEKHKLKMASVVYKAIKEIKKNGTPTLFKSHKKGIADGEQKRDFVSIEDVISVLHFAASKPVKRGIFNLGTGKAQTFLDLINAVFNHLKIKPKINFIDTPIEIRNRYQYFTEAKMEKLRAEGYENIFMNLNSGVQAYFDQLKLHSEETASIPSKDQNLQA